MPTSISAEMLARNCTHKVSYFNFWWTPDPPRTSNIPVVLVLASNSPFHAPSWSWSFSSTLSRITNRAGSKTLLKLKTVCPKSTVDLTVLLEKAQVSRTSGVVLVIMVLVQALTHIFAFHPGDVTGQLWQETPSSQAKQIWISNTKERALP